MQETGGTEPNLEGEIEGEETVIQVKMEDDSLSVNSVADLEARIRLLYFKVTIERKKYMTKISICTFMTQSDRIESY